MTLVASASCTRLLTPMVSSGWSVLAETTLSPSELKMSNHVGEVVLALRVVGVQTLQVLEKHASIEAVGAGVDLADHLLLRAEVLLLDDAGDRARPVAHDASVAGGVIELCGEDRQRRSIGLARCDERRDGLGPHQRRVAGEHDQRAIDTGQGVLGTHHGVPGAELLVLPRELRSLEQGLDGLGTVTRDGDDSLAAALHGGVGHKTHHRLAEDLVGHLGQRGLHARTLTGSENQSDSTHVCSSGH